jgi:hypothetical protein
MGAVYLAREIALDRLVAIKMLPPDVSDSDGARAKFRREAQLTAKLSHPHIVLLHSFRETSGVLFSLMGYVRGESLADRLRRDGGVGLPRPAGLLLEKLVTDRSASGGDARSRSPALGSLGRRRVYVRMSWRRSSCLLHEPDEVFR